jgi:phospholipid/cholesterol/gamma-HCH transport system substrate-binding protein
MTRKGVRDVMVGVVVLAAALIFTLGIFSIGSEQRVWVRKATYRLKVLDANGLASGSPVRLAGVQVGTITSVEFPIDPNVLTIEVRLAVDQAFRNRIRQDTRANIKILTMLGGDKYVELTPGTMSAEELPENSYIDVPASFGVEQLGELSANLADDLQSISGNVRLVLEKITQQEGLVGRVLLDPNFGDAALADLGSAAHDLKEITEKINSGKGLVGQMVTDEAFGRETTATIKETLAELKTLVARLNERDGLIDQALDPNGKLARSLDNFEAVSADLRDMTGSLKKGEGLAGRLVADDAAGREMMENFRKIAADLAEITDKMNRGDGTAGAFINDPQIYEDLKMVLRGVQKSKLMSGLIRHYREEGEQATQKEADKQQKQQQKKEGGSKPPSDIDPGGI